MNGKGDKPRPKSISEKEYSKRYEDAFGKKRPWWARRNKDWLEEAKKIKEKDNVD